MDSIRHITQQMTEVNGEDEPVSKRCRYLKFTPEQLSQLIVDCSTPGNRTPRISLGSPTSTAVIASSAPAYGTNAKYEEISCKPINPSYDGTEADLMPFLLRLDIRHQDEGWSPAAYVKVNSKTFDLTTDFTHVTESHVTTIASNCWDAKTVDIDKHTLGHETYHARLLAKCLLASISPDLALILVNRIPSQYRNDGTYLLWTLSNNIYRNNIAFVESIQEKIVSATVVQHDNDVEKYPLSIKNYLRMITSQSTSTKRFNGLITYILCQLKTTQNQIFLRYIQDLHVTYQVKDKIRVLRHAEVWDSSTTADAPAMALTATPTLTDQLKDFLANHITAEVERLIPSQKSQLSNRDAKDNKDPKDGKQRSRPNQPEWLYTPPQHPDDHKTVQNRTYNWCSKCNHGNGQWLIIHTSATHWDDYIYLSKRQDGSKRPTTQPMGHNVHLATSPSAPHETTSNQTGQISLQDGIANAFRFDVLDYAGDD